MRGLLSWESTPFCSSGSGFVSTNHNFQSQVGLSLAVYSACGTIPNLSRLTRPSGSLFAAVPPRIGWLA